MWLTYGIDADNSLVFIADAPRGMTQLGCPYCGVSLVARKGRINAPHFAHAGPTCKPAERKEDIPTLPLYDDFGLQLSARSLRSLRRLWDEYGSHDWAAPPQEVSIYLLARGLLKWNDYRRVPGCEFTHLGKIPFGALSLMLFNRIQEPLLLKRLDELEQCAATFKTDEARTDLRLYRAQFKRVLSCTLYFLEARVDGRVLHKIGVTARSVEERMGEILPQLRKHFGQVSLRSLGAWPHRGNVELYFKHRYARWQQRVGALTEFFAFEDPRPVIRDLRRMKPKTLSEIEQQVMQV
jgi:hypothetical protein